jgi:predicted amidohydrolase
VRVNADDAEVIDLTACAVAPGSMDLHVHLMARNATMDANYRYATFEVTPQAHMPHALVHAQMTIQSDFTDRDYDWVRASAAHTLPS